MEPVTFVSWRWQPPLGYRSTFPASAVYALREMITRHYRGPFRFVCVTDRPQELPGIEAIPLWSDYADVKSTIGKSYPSCYRRLKLFAPEAVDLFGPRVVSIDLDMILVRDVTSLFDRPEDFVGWGESDFKTQFLNGSLWMLRTGTRTQVWTDFDPKTSPQMAARAGARGSDQGWMSYKLGPKVATWGRKDGVYSWRKHIAKMGGHLPDDARVVAWHGQIDPWSYKAQQIPWVRAHYPQAVSA